MHTESHQGCERTEDQDHVKPQREGSHLKLMRGLRRNNTVESLNSSLLNHEKINSHCLSHTIVMTA